MKICRQLIMLITFVLFQMDGIAEEAQAVVLPGTPFQSANNSFDDVSGLKGLSILSQGGISIGQSENFGYNSFAFKLRMPLGGNSIGRHIIGVIGAANWFSPALNTIYEMKYLDSSEMVFQSRNKTDGMIGIYIQTDARLPNPSDWLNSKVERDILNENIENAPNENKRSDLIKEREKLIWNKVYSKSYHKPIVQIGVLFRESGTSSENTALGMDASLVGGVGYRKCDGIISLHYLKNFGDSLPEKDALTFTVGGYLDLDDFPPIHQIGIVFGSNYYRYKQRQYRNGSGSTIETTDPRAIEYSAALTYSGVFSEASSRGVDFAIKASKITIENHEKFKIALLTSTAFGN